MEEEKGMWMGKRECGVGGMGVDREEVEEKRRGQGRHDMTSDQPCH